MTMMKIGELATKTGLATSRIRFYERMGLLQLVERQSNGYRTYPPEAVMVLNLIKSAQDAGFSLEELRNLMPPDLTNWEHGKLHQALRDKVHSIEVLQQRLEEGKARILQVLKEIEAKPDDMTCAANARRVMSRMGLPATEAGEGGKQPSRSRMP